MLYFDDDIGNGRNNGQQNGPDSRNQEIILLPATSTGDTDYQSVWPHGWPRRAGRWDGMRHKEIPFLFDDRSIARHDRFPWHPYGPVVPDREHVNPETGRIDMDKVYDMMEDRVAVSGGDLSVLGKYPYQGGGAAPGAEPDGEPGVIQAQFPPGGISRPNPGHVGGPGGGPIVTNPGHIGGPGGGISTPNPGHLPSDREEQCRREWQGVMDQMMQKYNDCRQRPNWICQDPRQDPSMDYENYRRDRCRLK